jgi:hypothetical protein
LAADGGASSAADAAPASVPAVAAAAAVSAPTSAPGLAASAEGRAAATANSSEALADGLEDNGALAGGAPRGQDLSHHLLSGGWLLTFNWIRQESTSGGRHGTSSNGEEQNEGHDS